MSSQMASSSDPRGQAFPSIYPSTSQKVALTTAHAESAAVGSNTTAIEVCSDVACFIAIGPAPVATSTGTSCFLPALTKRIYAVHPGDIVSGIVGTSTGNLYITEGK